MSHDGQEMMDRRMRRGATFFLLVTCLASCPAWAQEPATGNAAEKSKEADAMENVSPGTTNEGSPPSPQTQPDLQPDGKIPPASLQTGQPLWSTFSPLHWKHLALLSFNATYIYDSNFFFRSDAPVAAQGTIVAGLLVYTFKVRHVELDFQYRPQLELSQAHSQFSYSNQSLDAHTFLHLTPRWTVNLSARFQSTSNNGSLGEAAFLPNTTDGSAVRTPLLAAGHGSLTNIFTASADRKLNGHDRISLLFQHEIASLSSLPGDTVSAPPNSAVLTKQQNLRAEIGWSRRLQHGSEAGLHYAYVHEHFPGAQGATQVHGILLSYSRRLSASLRLRVEGGPTISLSPSASSKGAAPATSNSYLAAGSLLKTFRHSSAVFSYARSSNFSGRITNAFSNRFDASYSRRFINRFSLTVGSSYVTQGQGQTATGESNWIQGDYRLARAWSVYSTYSYAGVISGNQPSVTRNLITSGIRWSAANDRR